MSQSASLARLIRNHPALALGLPWGLIMIVVMTGFSLLQGQALWSTLMLHIPIYGLGGLAFGFAMKWLPCGRCAGRRKPHGMTTKPARLPPERDGRNGRGYSSLPCSPC